MATLSPEGSPWDKILKDMGKEWEETTDGRVSLTVYPGGVAGDEPDILRKMKIGQYQGGAISVAGLVDIHKDFTVFEVPLFYRDFAEMTAVLNSLSPTLEKRLHEEGYQLLAWGYVGWVYFFTTEPARSVADMQKLKIMSITGDELLDKWWRTNGFKPVALAATDIPTGLQTGMIDAISVPPLYAMQVQFYKQAKYMADVPLAPMIGAVLVSKRQFDRLSEADQKAVLAAGKKAQDKVMETIPKIDDMAVNLMKQRGLEVIEIEGTPDADQWLEMAASFAKSMRGGLVPEAIFDEALAARAKHRAANDG